MTNPRHEPGATRHWGVINNILKSRSQASIRKKPAHRPQRAQETGERVTDGDNRGQPQPSRLPPHSGRSEQSNYHLQSRQRSTSPKKCSAPQSDRSSDQLQYRREHGRKERRRPGPSRAQQQYDRSRVQTRSNRTSGQSERSSTVTRGAQEVKRPSSAKRKRTAADESSDEEHLGPAKKQRPNHPMHKRPKRPVLHTGVESETVSPQSTATTTSPVVKGQHHSECETSPQLPTRPSSNGSPEQEIGSKQTPATNSIFPPTPAEKSCSGRTIPRSVGAEPTSRKRQRDDDVGLCEESKGLRQLKASGSTRSWQQPLLGLSPTPKQTRRDPRVLAHAVRPESSFASVIPNHACELKFLDYLHDSVPTLCSLMIAHGSDTDLINKPSGTLVVNALAIIGPSVNPQAERGWPSAIELPGRTVSATNAVRAVNDVDLYLHEQVSELCVAIDRGLITVTTYLELIGVSKRQPVRVEGCVPSWARATLRNPEKRRIVWQEKFSAGKIEVVPHDTVIVPHQLTLTLQIHVEVMKERAHIKAWEEQTRQQQEGRLGPHIPGFKEKQEQQSKVGAIQILTAEPGNLPLRAGSVVLVYAIDDEDNWAYGRLSGTDIMGRLQMAFTCPLDWSLDRFAATNDALKKPLKESEDPDEQDWRGFYHWVRQEGYAFGAIWKQTVEAGIAKARDEKSQLLAARDSRGRTETSSTSELTEVQPEHATSEQPLSGKESPGLDATASTAIMPSAATIASTAADGEVQEATPVVFSPITDEDAVSSRVEDNQAAGLIGVTRKGGIKTNAILEPDHTKYKDTSAVHPRKQQQVVMDARAGDQRAEKAENKEGMIEFDTNRPDSLTEQEYGELFAGSVAPTTEVEAYDTKTAGVSREAERETTEEETKTDTEASKSPVRGDSFTKPRLDLWTRNDDIEYDWGDSEEEL